MNFHILYNKFSTEILCKILWKCVVIYNSGYVLRTGSIFLVQNIISILRKRHIEKQKHKHLIEQIEDEINKMEQRENKIKIHNALFEQ